MTSSLSRICALSVYAALVAFVVILIAGTAYAQSDSIQDLPAASVPSYASPSAITADLEALGTESDLSEDVRTQAADFYKEALARYRQIDTVREELRDFQKFTPAYVAQQKGLYARELEAAEDDLETPLNVDAGPLTDEALLEIEQEISVLDGEAGALRAELSTIDERQARLTQRLTTGPTERDEARRLLQDIDAIIAGYDAPPQTALERARRASVYARRALRQVEIERANAALQAAPLELEILPLRKDVVQARLANVERRLKALRDRSGAYREKEAEARVEKARAELAATEGLHPMVTAFAEDNLQFALALKDIIASGGNFALQKSRLQREIRQIQNDKQLAQSILNEENIDRRYSAVLRQLRAALEPPNVLEENISRRSRLQLDISMARTLARDRLDEFPAVGLDADQMLLEWRQEFPDAPDLTPADRAALTALAREQKTLLTQSVSSAVRLNSELSEINSLEQDLARETEQLIELLDRELIWLPSAEPIGLDFPVKVYTAIQDRFSRSNVASMAAALPIGLKRHPAVVFILLLLSLLCIAGHRRLLSYLRDMAGKIGHVREDKYIFTPSAILIGLVSAARFALPIYALGYMMESGAQTPVANLFGSGMMSAAQIVFLLYAVREWARPRGLFPIHFGMAPMLAARLRQNMGWFIPLQVITTIVIFICEGPVSDEPSAALAVIGFLVSTLAFAVLAFRILFANHGLSKIVSDESFIGRHRRSIFIAVLIVPLLISALAFFGYFDTAIELQTRILITVSVLIVTYVLYGLVRRTVELAQRRTRLEALMEQRERLIKEREERAKAEEAGEDVIEDNTAPSIDYSKINVETLSRQSVQLLNLIVFISAGAFLFWLWSSLLPALSVLDNVSVWPYETGMMSETGEPVIGRVTLWNVVQGLAFLILTVIAARNLPSLLELFVLKRTKLTESGRYAITTVLGYAIVIIGVLISFDKLGLQWSSMKWVVGGLSVGIGFGLQEIIANFISGLIILMERPVRIGDWVTVGDKSGTVSRIQIRATTLTDLENVETVIPNKELITGRVTNWTLTSPVTRMTVPVGIAYGSDTAMAMNVMLEAAKTNKTVLNSPEPQVIFSGFGDSSLDFEIRVFLGSFSQRVPVRHQLHMAINEALEDAGISIPFPQRDLHIVSSSVDFAPKVPASKRTKSKTKNTPPVRDQVDGPEPEGE